MYKFRDTLKRKCEDGPFRPVSAMSYNGTFFEDYIDGYETLWVDGREMISLEFDSDNLLIGSLISSQRLPPRNLTIHYKLVNKDPNQLLIEYRKLMNFLYSKSNVVIYFNDELDVIYNGRFSSSDEPPGNTTSVVSSFQIYCEDPRKYTFKTFETTGYIGAETPIDTFPMKIEVRVASATQLKITNKKETITMLPNTIKSGDVVIFDFIGNKVLINGINKSRSLDIRSDFENFQLRQGATITCNNGQMKISYKGVSL